MALPIEQPREISPQEWLTPPVNYQMKPSKDVLDSNAHVANLMNKAKMQFIGHCLNVILDQETIGEAELEHLDDEEAQTKALLAKLDPSKFTLTLRPLYHQPLLKPEDAHLRKDQTIIRHHGDRVEFTYDRRTIGLLNFSYNTGEVQISATIDTEP